MLVVVRLQWFLISRIYARALHIFPINSKKKKQVPLHVKDSIARACTKGQPGSTAMKHNRTNFGPNRGYITGQRVLFVALTSFSSKTEETSSRTPLGPVRNMALTSLLCVGRPNTTTGRSLGASSFGRSIHSRPVNHWPLTGQPLTFDFWKSIDLE